MIIVVPQNFDCRSKQLWGNSMSRGPNEVPDLELVEEILFSPYGFKLEKLEETIAERTPDFRVIQDGNLAAFCEVKSPRDDWLENQLDKAPSGQIVGGLRNDPVFNRIARHITKAATQFDAVNNEWVVPNILVFVNHDKTSQYGDLVETVTGEFRTEDGTRHVTTAHLSEGRLALPKQYIDLYVWLDVMTKRIQGYVVNEAGPHIKKVCELFELDLSKNKR